MREHEDYSKLSPKEATFKDLHNIRLGITVETDIETANICIHAFDNKRTTECNTSNSTVCVKVSLVR